jgi:hypothetical protein
MPKQISSSSDVQRETSGMREKKGWRHRGEVLGALDREERWKDVHTKASWSSPELEFIFLPLFYLVSYFVVSFFTFGLKYILMI